MVNPRVYDDPADLPPNLLAACRPMPFPTTVLMCPPTYFDVIDVKNPHMAGNIGRVNASAAGRQWQTLHDTFERAGASVLTIDPARHCEDMVFCANQTLVGLDAEGKPLCIVSRMKHASRQREVPLLADWFSRRGYRIASLHSDAFFEGSGDAVWHPGRALLWGGYGFRTESRAYDEICGLFGVPVLRLALRSAHFYHLDTCLCAIDERTALIHAASFEPRGIRTIRAVFEDLIECPENETVHGMACNAAAIGGRHIIIQAGNVRTTAALRERGFTVHEVDTGEFLKSGGSVFCMKMYVF